MRQLLSKTAYKKISVRSKTDISLKESVAKEF
jgi:hypothetical protein